MSAERVPVILIAFNRPAYLEPVLDSVLAQRLDGCGTTFSLHVFQDGAVNRYSGKRHAEDADIAACVDLVARRAPHADLHVSPDNVGVSEMFAEAERFAFETLGAPWAIFLEDDMVLDPRYFATMAKIRAATADNDVVGAFAAYGDHTVPPEQLAEITREPQRWRPLAHFWGFALTRRHWEAMLPTLGAYRAIVHGRDYRLRDGYSVRRLFLNAGVPADATSQDAARTSATTLVGRVGLNIELPLGRYIGEQGLHFTPEVFRHLGYDATPRALPDGEVLVRPPSEDAIAEARQVQAHQRENGKRALEERFGFRLVTRDDVEALYRLLLDRAPESEAVYERNVGRQRLVDFRRGIVMSREYREKN